MGQSKSLLITADCGGSNSSRTRLWKVALQALADDRGLRLAVCHFPPCTTMVEIKSLMDPAMLIEIEVDAVVQLDE